VRNAEVDLLQEARAEVHRIAFGVAEEVLQEERYAAERTVGQGVPARLVARAVEEPVDHRVQLGVQPLDALDGGIDQLERARLPRSDEVGQSYRVEPREIVAHGFAYDALRRVSSPLR
jgi:hypothetical protein